jgi:hypothetical protein
LPCLLKTCTKPKSVLIPVHINYLPHCLTLHTFQRYRIDAEEAWDVAYKIALNLPTRSETLEIQLTALRRDIDDIGVFYPADIPVEGDYCMMEPEELLVYHGCVGEVAARVQSVLDGVEQVEHENKDTGDLGYVPSVEMPSQRLAEAWGLDGLEEGLGKMKV